KPRISFTFHRDGAKFSIGKRAMNLDGYLTQLREVKAFRSVASIYDGCGAVAIWIGERNEFAFALELGEARFLTVPKTAEERFVSEVHTRCFRLNHMRVKSAHSTRVLMIPSSDVRTL